MIYRPSLGRSSSSKGGAGQVKQVSCYSGEVPRLLLFVSGHRLRRDNLFDGYVIQAVNASAMVDSSGCWQSAYVNLYRDPSPRFDTAETCMQPGPIESQKGKVSWDSKKHRGF